MRKLVFIRLRRRPRSLAVDECVSGVCANTEPTYRCFGGFRHRRITLRSLGPCTANGFSAQRRRRVMHGGTTGFARGAPSSLALSGWLSFRNFGIPGTLGWASLRGSKHRNLMTGRLLVRSAAKRLGGKNGQKKDWGSHRWRGLCGA